MEIKKIIPCDMSRPYAFVSYKREDAEQVTSVLYDLQKQYQANIWIDQELESAAGVTWNSKALTALSNQNCKCVLFFMSDLSMMSGPVLAELWFSKKSKKVRRNNDGKELRIIPICLSDDLVKKGMQEWVNRILPKHKLAGEEIPVSAFSAWREAGLDRSYYAEDASMDNKITCAHEIANVIFEEIFENKDTITFTHLNVESIYKNLIEHEVVRSKADGECTSEPTTVPADNGAEPVKRRGRPKKDQLSVPKEKEQPPVVTEAPVALGGSSLASIRAVFSESERVRQFRAVREGMPWGGKGAMDYLMASLLGGCNQITKTSPVYQINYYLYAVASSEQKGEGLGATWTWSSNCRKVLGLEKSGPIPAEINDCFAALPDTATLSEVAASFRAAAEKPFQTVKNDLILQAAQRLDAFLNG